ncbi:hypothetical protein ANOM_001521 [Aspergillus nomiae NRRL 13137]|uniref:ATPase AAA-type core domain-containing protein n=1 Tax=Aspergillus nomiae NRRL (strain ATCC 15546 / NRRL 13137 / CBS 260.88 / M93) TaxID=1509407 RepID=A0A0L1JFE7_ASPN3|nr:uncharacterized protein ANOM_001521 [Aspergillus nomiae NRRL 13137]KNG90534.1 hypothetical protein ANOM_001521 [Aspergillus nomiae NRRL 13137]
MAPNVFIAGKEYCDRFRYLHYGGRKVTTSNPPGGAALVRDLLSQLERRASNAGSTIQCHFIKRENGTAIQTALEIEELAPEPSSRHHIKSCLQLESSPGDTQNPSDANIGQNDLLVLVEQPEVNVFGVDPSYRIFKRSGNLTEQSNMEWTTLESYAKLVDGRNCADDGWDPLGVVIDAEYLRWKHVEISRHLSWAQTTEDLLRNFVFKEQEKPELEVLRKTPNLIVRFDCDGVIHVENPTEGLATANLYIQKSENSEGDFIQSTPGRTPAIAAGFVAGLVRPLAQSKDAYKEAIQAGLLASHDVALAKILHVKNGQGDYYVLDDKVKGEDFPGVQVTVPSSEIKNQRGYRWSILQTILEGRYLEQPIREFAEGILKTGVDDSKIALDVSNKLSVLQPETQARIKRYVETILRKQADAHLAVLATKIAASVQSGTAAPAQLSGTATFAQSETRPDVENVKPYIKIVQSALRSFLELQATADVAVVQDPIETFLQEELSQEELSQEEFVKIQTEIKPFVKATVEGQQPELGDADPDSKITKLAEEMVKIKEPKGKEIERETKALADEIVTKGCKTALARIPTARFGNLMTADRQEKESFRAIANLVTEYLRSPQEKPISIGVFGAPGSGKSFGIKEVVKAVAERISNGGKKVSKPLTFNLSQFREYQDLVVAFHTVRDSGLSNEVPLVLFDEFDSGFGETKLGWLQYLLAPMQDGKFLEHGHQRPLGPAIFVFIGGTCSTFEDFTTDLATKDAKDAKKPDFVSRLRGFVNIQGSHQSPTDTDDMYLVRRAIHLRAMLQNRVGCKEDEEIELDDGVLNALLTVPYFRHGARSLESIIAMSQLHGQKVIRRSALPSAKQLGLHVDYNAFLESFEPENHLSIARVRAIARVKIAEKILPVGEHSSVNDDMRRRIADQVLDMIYLNKALLVPWSKTKDAEDEDKREDLVNDLAKYRYYAISLKDNTEKWEDAREERQKHIEAIKSLFSLLKGCGFAVRRGN